MRKSFTPAHGAGQGMGFFCFKNQCDMHQARMAKQLAQVRRRFAIRKIKVAAVDGMDKAAEIPNNAALHIRTQGSGQGFMSPANHRDDNRGESGA